MVLLDKVLSDENLERLLEEVNKRRDFESLIQISLQSLEIESLQVQIREKKSHEASVKLRIEADQLVNNAVSDKESKSLLDAWELYNKSIAYAEGLPSSALVRAYANRSSVLFHLGKLKECVRDIDRALEGESYPDHQRPNLLRRKVKCLRKLGDKTAEEVCEQARCLLENLTLSKEKKEKLRNEFDKAVRIPEIPKLGSIFNELPSFVPHPRIPCASEAIDLRFNQEMGRHYVANRDIKTGEVLMIEKPYATFLNTSNLYTHCSHCLVRAWDAIPCEHCVHALYCSQKCRDEAWEQYHDIECTVRGYLIAMKVVDTAQYTLKLTLLALRESGNIQQLCKELDELNNCKDDLMKIYSEDGILHSNKYRALYSLVTHESDRKSDEILSLSLISAMVLFYINKYTNVFNEPDKSTSTLQKNSDALFIGKLFVQNYMKIQLNNFEFGEFRSSKFHKLGYVVGSTASFQNHSCDPNVTRCPVFIDGAAQQLYFALHPIAKGSLIFDNYGCFFNGTPKSSRNNYLLSRYYFKCKCKACTGLWPLQKDLPSVYECVTDTLFKIDVGQLTTLLHQHINEIDFHASNQNSINIINDLIGAITKVYETTNGPSKEYYELIGLLKLAFFKFYAFKLDL